MERGWSAIRFAADYQATVGKTRSTPACRSQPEIWMGMELWCGRNENGREFFSTVAGFNCRFSRDIFKRVCQSPKLGQREDRDSLMGWCAGASSEVESSGWGCSMADSATNAGTKSKREIMVAIEGSGCQSVFSANWGNGRGVTPRNERFIRAKGVFIGVDQLSLATFCLNHFIYATWYYKRFSSRIKAKF